MQEPLRDSYAVHVKGARDAALLAVEGLNFKTSLSKEQVVARHCYALTFEKEYVEEWEAQLKAGQWYHEDDGEGDDLRPL
jgi:RNA-dependent RNA polymerase